MISSATFEIASFRLGSELIQRQLIRVQPDVRLNHATFVQFDTAPVPIARLDDGEREFVARGCFRAIRLSQFQDHGTLYAAQPFLAVMTVSS